jgi:peptide-methionine (S)-S-oxide reductase
MTEVAIRPTVGSGRQTMKVATFGAGCFWGVEASFRRVDGVIGTAVGYSGGTTENPTYEDVCSNQTGHAEVVRVEYDPHRVTYDSLLDVFWDSHDPTTRNRQGPDFGSQYRSVIFYHDDGQRAAAIASKQHAQASGRYRREIVTEILPAGPFYRAEEYHQQYYDKHGEACSLLL